MSSSSWKEIGEIPKWYRTISGSLTDLLTQDLHLDLTFQCSDGGVKAHKVFVMNASPLCLRLLESVPPEETVEGATIVVDNYSTHDISLMLSAIYNLAVPTDDEQLQTLMEMADFFEFFLKGPQMIAKHRAPKTTTVLNPTSSLANESEPMKIGAPAAPYRRVRKEISSAVVTKSSKVEQVLSLNKNEPDGALVPQSLPPMISKPKVCCNELDCDCGGPGAQEVLDIQMGPEGKWQVVLDHRLLGLEDNNRVAVKDEQMALCVMCAKPAIEHRFDINDAMVDGTGINASSDSIRTYEKKFGYFCCVEGCTCQNGKPNRTAKGFNKHMKAIHFTTGRKKGVSNAKVCPLCFKSQKEHVNEDPAVANKNDPVYKCCTCSAARLRRAKFFAHVEGHILKPFPCPVCFRGYSSQEARDKHVEVTHSDAQTEEFPCPHCPYTAKYKVTLNSHLASKHSEKMAVEQPQPTKKPANETRPEVVICPKCGGTYKYRVFQSKHRRSCIGGVSKGHDCKICGFTGNNKYEYNRHMQDIHPEKLTHECPECHKMFESAAQVTSHRYSVHSLDKAGNFIAKVKPGCHICGKVLSDKAKLQKHIRTVHEGVKNHKCSYCDKTFSSAGNKKTHEAVHTKDYAYKCNECEKKFAKKGTLIKHQHHAHGIPPPPQYSNKKPKVEIINDVVTVAPNQLAGAVIDTQTHHVYDTTPGSNMPQYQIIYDPSVDPVPIVTPGTDPAHIVTTTALTYPANL